MQSSLKWHGGKGAFQGKLAKWIISLMPSRDNPADRRSWNLFSEPYFGSGAVSFELDPEGISEIHNDINEELMNFWCCLQNTSAFRNIRRKLQATSFSRATFQQAKSVMTHALGRVIPADRAAAFFICCRQSRAGKMKDYATPTTRTRRGMNENVSAWLTAIEGLQEVHHRVQRMEFWDVDAVEFIQRMDHKRRLFYCDPPYLQNTRTAREVYKYEMIPMQHKELLIALASIEGRFLLSGYRSKMYNTFARKYGWHRKEFIISNNAAGGKKKRLMTECVWMNY